MIILEDLCHKCEHFDMGDYECKAGQFIDDLGANEIVAECEDFKENKE